VRKVSVVVFGGGGGGGGLFPFAQFFKGTQSFGS